MKGFGLVKDDGYGMYDLMGLGWNSIWVVLVIIVDRLCLLGIGFGKGW